MDGSKVHRKASGTRESLVFGRLRPRFAPHYGNRHPRGVCVRDARPTMSTQRCATKFLASEVNASNANMDGWSFGRNILCDERNFSLNTSPSLFAHISNLGSSAHLVPHFPERRKVAHIIAMGK